MSRCRKARRRLLALLDDRLDAVVKAQLDKHLAGCDGCRAAFTRLQQARAAVRQIENDPLPEVSYRQVEAQVNWRLARRATDEKKKVTIGRPSALLTLAATLIVGGVVGAVLSGALTKDRPPVPVRTVVVHKEARPATKPLQPPAAIELAALPNLIQGKVLVATEDGVIAPLELSRPVLAGERLITEQGEAALQWDQGSGLRLRPGSEVKLAQLTDQVQELVLLRGRIDVQAAKRLPARRVFAVVGGGIRATVKGTAYTVSLENLSARVRVDEGIVLVGPTGQHRWTEVVLASGQRRRLEGGVVELHAGDELEAVAGGVPKITRPKKTRRRPALNLQALWKNLHRMIATSGALLVESKPNGAEVHIDSVALGQTNLSARGPIGRHLVEVWRGNRLLQREWVQVGAGSSAEVKVARPTVRLPRGLYQVFRDRIPLIRACYERQLKREPKLAGRFTLRISIDADGKVSDARITLDTIPEPQVGRCALAVVKRWTFPPGQPSEVEYPFVFKPDRQ